MLMTLRVKEKVLAKRKKKNENGVNIISRKKEGELLLLRCYTIGLEDEGKGGEGKKKGRRVLHI